MKSTVKGLSITVNAASDTLHQAIMDKLWKYTPQPVSSTQDGALTNRVVGWDHEELRSTTNRGCVNCMQMHIMDQPLARSTTPTRAGSLRLPMIVGMIYRAGAKAEGTPER